MECKKDLRFLLVVLTSEYHDDTAATLQLLADETLCSYIVDNSVKVWAGDVANLEAFKVSQALGAKRFPFFAVVVSSAAASGSAYMSCVSRIDGLPNTIDLMSCLAESIERYGPALISLRADRQEQNISREIRAEQDSAYEISLRKDREKRIKDEQERSEAAARKEKEVQKQRSIWAWRRSQYQTIAVEPPNGQNVTRISFRMPNGTRTIRRFLGTSSISDVYVWVESQLHPLPADDGAGEIVDDYEHEFDFDLAVPIPRSVLQPGTQPLSDCKAIFPSGSLIVEMMASEEV